MSLQVLKWNQQFTPIHSLILGVLLLEQHIEFTPHTHQIHLNWIILMTFILEEVRLIYNYDK